MDENRDGLPEEQTERPLPEIELPELFRAESALEESGEQSDAPEPEGPEAGDLSAAEPETEALEPIEPAGPEAADGEALQPESGEAAHTNAAQPGRRLQKENTWRRLWKDYGYIPVTVVCMLLLFKVIFQIAWVPSGSMETTLPTKSLLFSWQLPYAVSDPTPQRGEIVTFWSDEMGKLLVKRVIGLPGDIVTFQDGFVYINGQELDESYLPRQGITASGSREEYVVPEGCLFFMGDNRTGSWDARSWNDPFVPVENVRSHVLLCISFLKDNSWRGVRAVA